MEDIFRKRATNCRALLRKMTYEDKASYGSSPLCTRIIDTRVITCLHVAFLRKQNPQKSQMISGSFAKIELQLKALYGSSSPCTHVITHVIAHVSE